MENMEVAAPTAGPIDIQFNEGILPSGYKETMQLAMLLFKSGLAPKSLDTVEKCAVASMMCMELGRPIMTGIQDLAVINGKCTIYGDAALALVRASGLLDHIKEWETGNPYTPEWTFHCEMKRKGSYPKTGTWSWADSIRAGHDKMQPPSPWAKYTRRMMQFKARNFTMRDEFGDVLKGIKTQEEAYDAIDMEPESNGSWGYSEPVPKPVPKPAQTEKPDIDSRQAPPAKSFHDEIVIPFCVADDLVDEFVRLTAKANGATVEKVKAEAIAQKDGFMTALKQWVKQKEENGAKEESKATEAPDGGGGCNTLINECNNLKSAGFSTWFYKNKARIAECDQDTMDKIKAKWERIYPDTKYPLLNAENVDTEPTKENGAATRVWCPENDSWKPVAVCESCGKAPKCQKYQEFLFENTDTAD